jgi:hypothetical protein
MKLESTVPSRVITAGQRLISPNRMRSATDMG